MSVSPVSFLRIGTTLLCTNSDVSLSEFNTGVSASILLATLNLILGIGSFISVSTVGKIRSLITVGETVGASVVIAKMVVIR
ncbi:hypothetical protein AYI68_g5620 [Smittium mucronatum]|uniref:Uncharacterized protein n=1 Tax=Smittium mucronatum TaxID=133383 RepID=A0A1R0GTS2_9FUNG|nr:hypothetical protein AYI68_g5620 [Smittium mucronatum]